jgi:hypothetical protein
MKGRIIKTIQTSKKKIISSRLQLLEIKWSPDLIQASN